MRLPKALLIDLDDTLICYDGVSEESWSEACTGVLDGPIAVDTLIAEINRYSNWFFGDPKRHRVGRNDLEETRRMIVREALKNLDMDNDRLGDEIGDRYSAIRDEKLFVFPGARQALDEVLHLQHDFARHPRRYVRVFVPMDDLLEQMLADLSKAGLALEET